ncbi:transcriptional regulator [Bacillus thuringiensis serovar pakistani str. T13001]|nr:transcriptional regulator [Bacillus thuringiensis serovar pakistani str. T13001]
MQGGYIMQVRIKEIRKNFGDTLQSLAHKIDYDYSNLSKVERGIYTPSLELLYKIADVYNIEITDLLCQSHLHDKKNVSLEQQNTSEKYLLSLDGKQISEDELEFLIQSVRIFRDKLKKYKETNK